MSMVHFSVVSRCICCLVLFLVVFVLLKVCIKLVKYWTLDNSVRHCWKYVASSFVSVHYQLLLCMTTVCGQLDCCQFLGPLPFLAAFGFSKLDTDRSKIQRRLPVPLYLNF
jgi:hypothetical protein